MGYILWALLNIASITLFLVICFHATKLIKQKFGLFFSVVFVLGLLSFSNSSKEGNKTIDIKKWKFIPEGKPTLQPAGHLGVILKTNMFSLYKLSINYGTDSSNSTNIPISAYSPTTGSTCGTTWIPEHISVVPTENNRQFEYHVAGVEEWRLLGNIIFTKGIEFEGTIDIE